MAVPAEEARIVQAMAGDAREFLMGLVRFRSTHGNEAEAMDYVAQHCRAAGLEPSAHAIPDSIKSDPQYTFPEVDRSFEGRPNCLFRLKGPRPGRTVIINSHVDVVPADDWPEAFSPRLEDDTVFGRGACDAKGCVAALYLAARAMKKLGLPAAGEVIFQFVIDEEVGGNGTLALIREGIKADGAVVIEPTNLAVHPANRGAIWFRFEFEGRSCHMGRKHEGLSAIELACETLSILAEYEKELVRDQDTQPLFAYYEYPAQVNVGTLHGGHFPSAVSGSAVMEGGVGFLPNRPMEQVKDDLVRYIDNLGSDRLKSHYKLSFPKLHNDSYETPVEDPLVQALHKAACETRGEDEIAGWNVSCDARLFAKVAGLPTVVFGPGMIDDAHSASEKIRVSDIATAAETLVKFVQRWCVET